MLWEKGLRCSGATLFYLDDSVDYGKHILLRTVQLEGEDRCPAADYFTKVHEILGIDWLSLYQQLQSISR